MNQAAAEFQQRTGHPHGYKRIRDFRRVFVRTLKCVKIVYHEARFVQDDKGLRLWNSPPPVPRRLQDIESDTGYDTRRCAPDGALARLSQTAVYDTC